MKAIGYRRALPIDDPDSLVDVELPEPEPGPRDLLVDIKAVSVNPVDTKVRRSTNPAPGEVKVLGYDAAGVVRQVGPHVTLFAPGDKVWYAGSILRPGTNSERHVVDERIVGRMPQMVSFAEAAALPLTAITAWELLFDRLQLVRDPLAEAQSLLVIGAAGGVGSILVQLARKLTPSTIIGTASSADSEKWVLDRGAHYVISHRMPLAEELSRIGVPNVTHVASLTNTQNHFAEIVKALAPEGKFGLIDDPGESLDLMQLKPKSISLHWEFMFTRSMFETPGMVQQHRLLNVVARLIDSGALHTTLAEHSGTINAVNLRSAHARIESGSARGKIVLEGF